MLFRLGALLLSLVYAANMAMAQKQAVPPAPDKQNTTPHSQETKISPEETRVPPAEGSASETTAQKIEKSGEKNGQGSAFSPEADKQAMLLAKMHMANHMEIQAGELAKRKATTPEIRRYGELLVRDHQLADKRIVALALRERIQLTQPIMPDTPEEKQSMEMQKHMLSELELLQGADFDRKFIDFSQKAHEMAVSLVQSGLAQLQPSVGKTLTGRMLPILQQHKDLAGNLSHDGAMN